MVLELIHSGLPVVTIDHMFNGRMAVMSDNVAGMEALVRYVVGRGHRRLAFIHGEQTTVTDGRLTGFYRACEELGIQVPEEWIRRAPSTTCRLLRGDEGSSRPAPAPQLHLLPGRLFLHRRLQRHHGGGAENPGGHLRRRL